MLLTSLTDSVDKNISLSMDYKMQQPPSWLIDYVDLIMNGFNLIAILTVTQIRGNMERTMSFDWENKI